MNELFIGGGGYDGITYIGALEYIHKNKLLDLKRFYGCSIGSLIGVLYSSGCNPLEMLTLFLEENIKDVVNYDINNIDKKCILDDSLLEKLASMINKYHNENITFLEFYESTKIDINIYATNITKNEYFTFNKENTPKVRVKDAIKASMSIPFLFRPVEIDGELYIDGCCKNIFGSPPDNHFILGYAIIGVSKKNDYVLSVLKSMIKIDKPSCTFLIECNKLVDIYEYGNLKTKNNLKIFDMYKAGINFSKTVLPIGIHGF